MRGSAAPTALRVGTYGFFGMGNLGNEGSLAAFLAEVRSARPDASLTCFGADADSVEREHGIRAVRLMAYRAKPADTGLPAQVRKAIGRIWDVPRTLWLVGRVDALVVPGTGVLESKLMSTPWGLPYWMFLAFASCRLRGRPAALLSVGAEPAPHPVTRLLMRGIVRLATYVSYRDEPSVEAARSMGAVGTPGSIAPDLAFSLPAPPHLATQPGHVAIGVMTFLGGADDPQRGDAVVDTYVDGMTDAITRLVDAGRTVSLLVGDRSDHDLADRIEGCVRRARPGLASEAVTTSRADDLDSIMEEMARSELVIASRFHNVICALKTRRPTISLGYARKNADLLTEFGLGAFSQPMDSLDVDRLMADVEAVGRDRDEIVSRIEETLRVLEDRLAEQYREMSAAVLDPALRARHQRRPRRRLLASGGRP